MDIEFHYYMTYLIAARAGFAPAEAAIIAQSAQEIDDNHIPIVVSAGTPYAYESVLSQTMDMLDHAKMSKTARENQNCPGTPFCGAPSVSMQALLGSRLWLVIGQGSG